MKAEGGHPGGHGLALGLMAASGAAGLGYQIVWTQQAALWLGHESPAVLAVVAAFFGGLAIGALALGRRIARSPRPARWYAGCELLIAAWAALLVVLMPPASRVLLAATGAQPQPAWQWAVAFGGTLLLLLPATAAMGATLPAIAQLTAQLRTQGRAIAGLYAANTAGALAGVLAAAFWAVPTLGLARTAALCVVLNLACAAAALWAWRGLSAATPAPAPAEPSAPTAGRATLARLAATGLLGIGYEVLVVRVLSQVAEDTVYTFALLLAVYLVGTALGAAAWQRWGGHRRAPSGDGLLVLLALACAAGSASLWGAEALKAAWLASVAPALGHSLAAVVSAEAALALAAFALPTAAMGAVFSQLCTQAQAEGIGFHRALGINTLGAALAPALFGVLLLPLLGAQLALALVPAGYLALLAPACWRRATPWLPLAATVALAALAPPLQFIDVPDGGQVLHHEDGAMAAVSVVADAQGVARLRINNRQQEGSSASLGFDARQALLPLLLHPAPRRALFLGLGTGLTAATAAEDLALQADAVELLPEVIAAARHFRPVVDQAFGHDGTPRPLTILAADARRYVLASATAYDLVVADNFHPARSGSGALYTVEHFRAVRARLAPGGLFCQWLPLHQLDLATLRPIVQSFLAAYPGGRLLLANNSLETPTLGLLGQADDAAGFDPAQVDQRIASARLTVPPARFGLADRWAVLGSFVAGPAALHRFAGNAPANTNDRPVVAYRAPRITYLPDSAPRERLLALLAELTITPAELLTPNATPADAARLAAYGQAQRQFLAAGRHVAPTADLRAMVAQVQGPLLAVLRTSPDFRPAYDPLLGMALALAQQSPDEGRALLRALAEVVPARPEAVEALRVAGEGSGGVGGAVTAGR